jgi:hypothetical protein
MKESYERMRSSELSMCDFILLKPESLQLRTVRLGKAKT